MNSEKGTVNITIIIIFLIISGAVAIFVSNTIKTQNTSNKLQEQTSSSSSPQPTSTPIPSSTPSPKPQPTSKPTPTQTPMPTVKQPLLTTKVYLGRSHSNMPASSSGDGEIRLMNIDPYMSEGAKIASLQYDFSLRGLEVEREYSISICTIREGGDCVGLSTVKTDKSGNASYSGNSGITITKDRPFKAIKVTHRNEGFCSNSGSPCLRGELSLEIKF